MKRKYYNTVIILLFSVCSFAQDAKINRNSIVIPISGKEVYFDTEGREISKEAFEDLLNSQKYSLLIRDSIWKLVRKYPRKEDVTGKEIPFYETENIYGNKFETDCKLNLEKIFKVHDFKIRYEAVNYIYNARAKNNKFMFSKNGSALNVLFELINGYPMESEKQQDSISKVRHKKAIGFEEAVRAQKEGINPGKLVEVEWMSEAEIDGYIEELHCTPKEAHKEYRDLIRDIKLEKEIYMKCIDAELAKDDLSEYAKAGMLYKFLEPGWSLMGLPRNFTKLGFLKIFKEFILNDDDEVLPDGVRVHAYLKCGCKIP
jgi:hypothetical protein